MPQRTMQRRTLQHVADGSKPEKLNASTCFPLYLRKQTLCDAVGMSVWRQCDIVAESIRDL
jgi:hypothetical protein